MANKERHTEPCGTMATNEGYSKQTNRTALPGLSKEGTALHRALRGEQISEQQLRSICAYHAY